MALFQASEAQGKQGPKRHNEFQTNLDMKFF